MKSAHKPIPRREALTKYIRAKAHREGTLFVDALQSVALNENGRGSYIPRLRPNERLPDREIKNRKGLNQRLAKTPHVERPDHSMVERSEETHSEVSFAPRRTDMTVSILKIARKAKGKGIAREFEVVRNVRNVIALPEENDRTFPGNDDEWEKVFDEEELDTRRSYSSVLRGNEKKR